MRGAQCRRGRLRVEAFSKIAGAERLAFDRRVLVRNTIRLWSGYVLRFVSEGFARNGRRGGRVD